MFIPLFSLISFTFGAVIIFDQAFVKSIKSWQGKHVFVVIFLKGKIFVKGGMWLFGLEPWILISLDSSVVEHHSSF